MTPTKNSYSVQPDLEAIKKAIRPEDRLKVVEQRKHSSVPYAKKLTIGTNLAEASPAFTLFQEAGLYHGSPVKASLDANMSVVYAKTAEGLIRWRIDDAIGGAPTREALRCLIETLFEDRNEHILMDALKALRTSRSLKNSAKTSALDVFDKVLAYRQKVANERAVERLENLKDVIKNLPKDQVQAVLAEFGSFSDNSAA